MYLHLPSHPPPAGQVGAFTTTMDPLMLDQSLWRHRAQCPTGSRLCSLNDCVSEQMSESANGRSFSSGQRSYQDNIPRLLGWGLPGSWGGIRDHTHTYAQPCTSPRRLLWPAPCHCHPSRIHTHRSGHASAGDQEHRGQRGVPLCCA